MSSAQPSVAFEVLSELAHDRVWFVRLRAIVSLGKLSHPQVVPVLLRGLTDSNRLVRLRAAESLVRLNTEMAAIFEQVVATRDRYGLHAYLTAVENADLRQKLEAELQASTQMSDQRKTDLGRVLQSGTLPAEELNDFGVIPAKTAVLP